jgi:hypothetical protein
MAEEGSVGKTGDFFVGLVDFFAILLPGGLLAFLFATSLRYWDAALDNVTIPEGWIGFALVGLVSYLLGHFLSVVASLCLDPVYDWWKSTWLVWDPRGWKSRGVYPSVEELFWRAPGRPPLEDHSLNALWSSLKELDEAKSDAGASLKHAAITLRLASSGAAAEMDHLEADQKFFRGLILVFLFAWLTFFGTWTSHVTAWHWGGAGLLLFPMFPFKMLRLWWTQSVGQGAQATRTLAKVQLGGVALLLGGWIAWFAMTPPAALPFVREESRADTPAISLTARGGSISVTAKSENNQDRDVVWRLRRDHPAEFGSVLLFGLALSVVRFVQLRLKYSKFVYYAYRIATTARAEGESRP